MKINFQFATLKKVLLKKKQIRFTKSITEQSFKKERKGNTILNIYIFLVTPLPPRRVLQCNRIFCTNNKWNKAKLQRQWQETNVKAQLKYYEMKLKRNRKRKTQGEQIKMKMKTKAKLQRAGGGGVKNTLILTRQQSWQSNCSDCFISSDRVGVREGRAGSKYMCKI